ncbi:MAG: exosortase H [Xanthomonadales bacterium]|nr:exosortase H [Xanthomonadales bacterium]
MHSRAQSERGRRPRLRYTFAMLRFTVLFLFLLVGLFVLCLLPVAERHFVEPFTAGLASICTSLVSMFDANVLTYGKIIQSTSNGFAISIERGCNGIEAMIVLTAAVLAFPAPWKHRLVGLAIGFVAIQGLNLVRIISLFYLGQWSMTAFEWFHLYIWQALIILDALVVWLIWLKYLPPQQPAAGAPATA